MLQGGILRSKYPSSELVGLSNSQQEIHLPKLIWAGLFLKEKRTRFWRVLRKLQHCTIKKFLSLATFAFSTTALVDAVLSEACHRLPCAIRAFTVDK